MRLHKEAFLLASLAALAILCNQIPVSAAPCESIKNTDESSPSVSSEKNKFGHKALKVSIKINATAKFVWEAIRENRLADPDVQYTKMTQITESQRLIEQKYASIPLFGSTTCLLKLDEDLNKRIDFCLLKSDRLSEFEGSWELTPSEDSQSTILELSNHVKLNVPLPQKLIDAFAAPKMKARIMFVKNLAENRQQLQIASKN